MIVPILWALVSTAEATSRIVVTSDVPVLVSVNGHPYTPKSTSYAILCDAGRNKVQAGNSLVIIDVPDGHEARMVVKTGKLTLTETVFVEGLKELDYVDYYYDPNEDPASRPRRPRRGAGHRAVCGGGRRLLQHQERRRDAR